MLHVVNILSKASMKHFHFFCLPVLLQGSRPARFFHHDPILRVDRLSCYPSHKVRQDLSFRVEVSFLKLQNSLERLSFLLPTGQYEQPLYNTWLHVLLEELFDQIIILGYNLYISKMTWKTM